MIILITGTPGAGKSLFGVSELLNKAFKDRPLFVNGVPDLLLTHEPFTDEDVTLWFDGRLPVNGVLFIDEAQRIWRPRAASVKVPESLTAMETHRHKGVDIVAVTQHPNQLDAHLRRLVGRHIHVRRTWGLRSAVVYEWDSCNNALGFKTAQSKVWRYNKKAFSLYKSSEKHTKAGGSVPFVVYVVIAAMLAVPVVGWQTTKRLLMRFGIMDQEAAQLAPGVAPGSAKGQPPKPSAPGGSAGVVALTPQQYVDQFRPRIVGMMHSAPAYDSMTAPKIVPLPAACILSNRPSWVKLNGGPCGCYTQTGNRYDTTQELCVEFVNNRVFFPFIDPAPPKQAQQQVAKPTPASPVAPAGSPPALPPTTS